MKEQRRRLLIIEDDATFARTLGKSFEKRGYEVVVARSAAQMTSSLDTSAFDYAIVDLKLGDESGLVCVEHLHLSDEKMVIVVLTGYASIATAVEAIKLGATHYLPKPANTDEIEAAFERIKGNSRQPISSRRNSLKTLEWERINQVLAETSFNISETARQLGMHRRTLARKLKKRPIP